MFGSRITKGKREKNRSISAFKPNAPALQYSNALHVDITQIATDIPITNRLDSHPLNAGSNDSKTYNGLKLTKGLMHA